MTDLAEHLVKMRRIAEGGLRTTAQRHPSEVGRSFWDGYRQAVEDLRDFAGKEGLV